MKDLTQQEYVELMKKPDEFNKFREEIGYTNIVILGIDKLEVFNLNLKNISFESCYSGTFKSCNSGTFKSCNSGTFESCNSGTFKSCYYGTFESCNSGTFKSCDYGTFESCNSGTFKSCYSGTFKSCYSGTFESCYYGTFKSCYYGQTAYCSGNQKNSYLKNNWGDFKLENPILTDQEAFAKIKKLEIINNSIIIFKSVNPRTNCDFKTGKIKYEGIVDCPDYLDKYQECGNGLHLSATPQEALEYNQGKVLKCRVNLDDISVYPLNLTKVRCRRVEVLGGIEL